MGLAGWPFGWPFGSGAAGLATNIGWFGEHVKENEAVAFAAVIIQQQR